MADKTASEKPAANPKKMLKPKRRVSAQLKPAVSEPKPMAKARQPSKQQIAAWKALLPEQKTTLRDREAVRLFAIAVDHHRKQELQDAVKIYGKALLLNPKMPDLYNNMGVALRALGKLEASVACYRRSLVLKPDASGVYSNLGNVLRELGRLQVAVASHRQAVKLAPNTPETHYNLGLVFRDLGQIDQAMACFERTLSLNPDHVDCHWDHALTLLSKGDLAQGFDEYEWRWKLPRSPARGFEQPLWNGKEMKGKTLLVHQEQGFGDMIQFARFLPEVKKRLGGILVVEVQVELATLFSAIEGVDKVINKGSALPKFDSYIPMMSLARLFEVSKKTIPRVVPYLTVPDPQSVQLPASMARQRKVGIVWRGKSTHLNDKNRSCDFTQFIELMGIPGVSLYSLQKGPAAAEIADAGCEALIVNLGPALNDFADTAAVIAGLDLVITVDTAVAHMAGALGVKTWVALPFAPDWRWMLETPDTPWYPSVQLFRQPRPGQWGPVFTDIRKALRAELDLPPSKRTRA